MVEFKLIRSDIHLNFFPGKLILNEGKVSIALCKVQEDRKVECSSS